MSGWEDLLEAIDETLNPIAFHERVRLVQVAIGTATDEEEAGRSAEWLRRHDRSLAEKEDKGSPSPGGSP